VPKAIAIGRDDERGRPAGGGSRLAALVWRSPKDSVAGLFATAAVMAVFINALFLQTGRHPSPLFATVSSPQAASAANPMPRARPVEADSKPVDSAPRVAAKAAPAVAAPVTAPAAPKPAKTESAKTESAKTDPLGDLIVSSRRLTSVQRVLADYGYGQFKATGVMNAETKAAIEKFERERKLPITGQVSERLVRELAVITGKPLD
jgi:hypothetical protein